MGIYNSNKVLIQVDEMQRFHDVCLVGISCRVTQLSARCKKTLMYSIPVLVFRDCETPGNSFLEPFFDSDYYNAELCQHANHA